MSRQEFIETVAKAAKKYASKYGFNIVSIVIAQACLESGYGTSNKAKHHNYFGLKYRANRVTCHSGTFVDGSKEQNGNGSYVAITDQWYEFASLDSGVEGYFQFINVKRYENLKEVKDAREYLELLRKDGYATSLDYVKNVWRIVEDNDLTKYDRTEETNMANSSLVNVTKLSPNHSGKRTHNVDRITPHCVVGQLSAEGIAGCFPAGRQASCNYGIGSDGRVSLIVDEANRSWCSSSNANDQRAITIECASDKTHPYAMTNAVYEKLIALCVDICKRYGKTKLLWFADKNKSLNYNPASNEMVLTVHRWFANKSCPGDWLYNRLGDVANRVTAQLGGAQSTGGDSKTIYRVQCGAFSQKSNADKMLAEIKSKGIDAFITQVDNLYKVQVGAYSVKANAEAQMAKMKSLGYDCFITTNGGKVVVNKKSNAEIAKEVIQGKWGNGQDRVNRLTAAGYDAKAVQAEVNKLV